MSQTLQGQYYEAGQNGYFNRGMETIKFSAKVNHLHAHSRCNKLLKSQDHPIQIFPTQKLEAVHCYHNVSIQKSNSVSPQNRDKFHDNVSLVKKAYLPKIYRQNNINPEEKGQKSDDGQSKNSKRNQRKFMGHHMRRSSRSQCRQQMANSINQFSPTIKEKEEEKIKFAKGGLKNSFSPISIQYSPQEFKSDQPQEQEQEQEQKQLKIRIKKMNTQEQINQQRDNDECVTEHAVYEPQKINNYKILHQSKYVHDQKLLGELSTLVKKVAMLEQKIKTTEEQFIIKNLQCQINKSHSKLTQLNAQNARLKAGHGTRQYCCGFGCKKYNMYESNGFLLFIIFMLGILFTKAALC